MKLKIFDYFDHCKPCLACCKNENLFLSEDEKIYFGNKEEKENCHNLLDDGKCKIHENRPIECRMYPLDIKRIDGELKWVVWESCPATPFVPEEVHESQMKEFESTLRDEWVSGYVQHHERNEPEKYSTMIFRVIRVFVPGHPVQNVVEP